MGLQVQRRRDRLNLRRDMLPDDGAARRRDDNDAHGVRSNKQARRGAHHRPNRE